MAASFYSITNPTPDVQPSLIAATEAATAAAVAAATAANEQLAAYTVVTDTWSSNVTIDWGLANCHRLTLMGPTNLTFVGGVDGEKLTLELTQGGSGGHTISFPGTVRAGTTVSYTGLSVTPGYVDKLGFMRNTYANKYDFVSIALGFHT